MLSKYGEVLIKQPYEMYECDESLNLNVADSDINIKEIESAIRSLKCKKAAGADRIAAEIIKCDHASWTCSVFCAIYGRNQGRSLTRCSHRAFV